jgi:hypothetical protein
MYSHTCWGVLARREARWTTTATRTALCSTTDRCCGCRRPSSTRSAKSTCTTGPSTSRSASCRSARGPTTASRSTCRSRRGAESNLELMNNNSQWEVTRVHKQRNLIYYECCPEAYVDVTYSFYLRRRSEAYRTVVITPATGKNERK